MADWLFRTVSERKFEQIVKLCREKYRAKKGEPEAAKAPVKAIKRGVRK
jgi:hypothetical protein